MKYTKVIYVMELGKNGEDESYLCLTYNETGRLEDMLGYEPFKTQKEFSLKEKGFKLLNSPK